MSTCFLIFLLIQLRFSYAFRVGVGLTHQSRRNKVLMMSDGGIVVKERVLREADDVGRVVSGGDIVAVKFTARVKDSGAVIAESEQEQLVVNDGSMIRGWDEALLSMRVGESARFAVGHMKGYGSDGIRGVVPPRSDLELDIDVLAWLGNSLNPESLFSKDLDIDPFVSSTPEAIQRDYDDLQNSREMQEKYEGSVVDIYLRRIKNISFGFGGSGFFVSQSGEKAPWYLNPNLTFPAMILITIGTAVVTFGTGSIKEKGVSDVGLDVARTQMVREDDRHGRRV